MPPDDPFRKVDHELVESNHTVTARIGTRRKYGIDDDSDLFDDRRQWMNTWPARERGNHRPDGDRQPGRRADTLLVQKDRAAQQVRDCRRTAVALGADGVVLISAQQRGDSVSATAYTSGATTSATPTMHWCAAQRQQRLKPRTGAAHTPHVRIGSRTGDG
jgi:hypothetical protein